MSLRQDMSKNIMYSNNMRTNRNELMRRLLTGVTKEKLEFLVRTREEARRQFPCEGEKQEALFP